MGGYILKKGEQYGVVSADGKDSMKLFYVRKETWQDGKEWETFFTMMHDREAYINMAPFSFCRMRVPADKILVRENGIIEGTFTKRHIWYDEKAKERGPLVKGWLNDTKQLMESMGFVNVEDIFRWKKTWNGRKIIPPCLNLLKFLETDDKIKSPSLEGYSLR